MRRDQSLKHAADFQSVRRDGRSWADHLLVLAARRRGLGEDGLVPVSRFGFSVSRRRLGNAVVRNRVKRRLRAAVRGAGIEDGWDVVLIARRGVIDIRYSEIERSLAGLLARAGIRADGPSAGQPRGPQRTGAIGRRGD